MSTEHQESKKLSDCLPCQIKLGAESLINLCQISNDLKQDIDCKDLADKYNNGEIDSETVIDTVLSKATGNEKEYANKIIDIIKNDSE